MEVTFSQNLAAREGRFTMSCTYWSALTLTVFTYQTHKVQQLPWADVACLQSQLAAFLSFGPGQS